MRYNSPPQAFYPPTVNGVFKTCAEMAGNCPESRQSGPNPRRNGEIDAFFLKMAASAFVWLFCAQSIEQGEIVQRGPPNAMSANRAFNDFGGRIGL
jgi:hypothetical protein